MIEFPGYYDRTDPDKGYDQHLFLAGTTLQSAELNEIQIAGQARLRSISDVLFNDGAVMAGAEVFTSTEGDVCTCDAKSGAIYVAGAVRGVLPRVFFIPATGAVSIGVRLTETVVTAIEDPALYDPAVNSRNQGRPGAGRLRVAITWGYAGDGQEGAFYPVYAVIDGVLQTKQPPPQVDATSLAIARYDRQSAGGMYVSNGLKVTCLADAAGLQVYSISEGVARINGEELMFPQGRRFAYATAAATSAVALEQHVAVGGTERVPVWHTPIAAISQVAITREVSVIKTRGPTANSKDFLSPTYTSVMSIVSVTSGATTYAPTTDYLLTSDAIDWAPGGAEPASGTTYTAVIRYIELVDPATLNADATGFTVSGAVVGSAIQVSYTWNLPRFDVLCVDSAGALVVVNGPSFPANPQSPAIPGNLLALARITQDWRATTRAVVDIAVRMVPMQALNAVNRRIDTLFALVAEERLRHNLSLADQSSKKGVFVDPFFDDDLRDQGLAQTTAIAFEELTLGITSVVHTQSLAAVATLDLSPTLTEVLAQPLRTGSYQVNPYDAFTPLPALAQLQPAVDFWVDIKTEFLSPITRQFYNEVILHDPDDVRLHPDTVITEREIKLVGSTYVDAQYLRQQWVRFDLAGFGAGEQLVSVIFDDIPVTAQAIE